MLADEMQLCPYESIYLSVFVSFFGLSRAFLFGLRSHSGVDSGILGLGLRRAALSHLCMVFCYGIPV